MSSNSQLRGLPVREISQSYLVTCHVNYSGGWSRFRGCAPRLVPTLAWWPISCSQPLCLHAQPGRKNKSAVRSAPTYALGRMNTLDQMMCFCLLALYCNVYLLSWPVMVIMVFSGCNWEQKVRKVTNGSSKISTDDARLSDLTCATSWAVHR